MQRSLPVNNGCFNTCRTSCRLARPRVLTRLLVILIVSLMSGVTAVGQEKKVKIFILAGQSNMEGKGSVRVLDYQLKNNERGKPFARYRDKNGWVARPDVAIHYLGNKGRRTGPLTIGYGISKPDSVELFGPELGFGWTVGDHYEQPVLLIKTAWGGKSIDRDFRPPSRKWPESMQAEFEKRKKRNEKLTLEEYQSGYGHFYRQMINEVKTVTADLGSYVPGYKKEHGFELAGFIWFQGWNDQYAPTSVEDYGDNLAGLINDVRQELQAPKMKFVIGAMGHHGEKQKGKIKQIADAQVEVARRPEFSDNVRTVETTRFWDTVAEDAFEKYWADKAKRDVEKWRQFGNDRAYHYLGSPHFFNDAGVGFAKAMLELLGENESGKEK